ncbi:MAG: helix-turn-helix domain-containing protein [Anaerolineae bacterium]|nr:helix-turn-helix domain-containing protein [Anaerolineae bacterium]
MSVITKNLESQWAAVAPILSIRSEREYDAAIKRLNLLVDEIGTNVKHPLCGLLDTLGTLVHAYEESHYPMPDVSGAEMLRYLMDEHSLRQSDLREIGSQGVVSEIIKGRRELNVRQIRALAKRFGVSPAVFIS